METQRRRLIWKRLVAVGLALVAGGLLAEMALRALGISYPVFYTVDPDLASRHLPGARGRWLGEGRGYVRINRAGLRDREHSIPRPDEAFRIALLGDSYCEAFQVDIEEAFWSVMETRLARCRVFEGRKPEVINFGVSGYSTAQQLLQLRRDVWKYDPQVVLLAFTPRNDVRDNLKPLAAKADPQTGPVRPFFELRGGELVLDDSFRTSAPYIARSTRYERLKAAVVNTSRVLQLLKHVKQHGFGGVRQPRLEGDEAVLQDARACAAIYAAPESKEWAAAWEVTERLIAEMHQETRRHGAKFFVVVLSTCLQVYPDRRVRQRFMDERGIEDLFYPNRRIVELGQRIGFPVLDIAEPLQALADRDGVLFHGAYNTPRGVGHYNAAGHQAVGQHLADWLCDELSPKE